MRMNPLAAYLLKELKRQPSIDNRKAQEYEDALSEFGYWILSRPVRCPLERMPSTNIACECEYMESFKSAAQPDEDTRYNVMVDVYAEPYAINSEVSMSWKSSTIFAEVMQSNPPRLVVKFQRAHDGSEQFEWGVVSYIPVLSMIGYIVELQGCLSRGEWMPECDQPALVVTYDPTDRSFATFVHRDVPATPIVGMLEIIKTMLVDSRMAQHAGAQNRILGPDGKSAK